MPWVFMGNNGNYWKWAVDVDFTGLQTQHLGDDGGGISPQLDPSCAHTARYSLQGGDSDQPKISHEDSKTV